MIFFFSCCRKKSSETITKMELDLRDDPSNPFNLQYQTSPVIGQEHINRNITEFNLPDFRDLNTSVPGLHDKTSTRIKINSPALDNYSSNSNTVLINESKTFIMHKDEDTAFNQLSEEAKKNWNEATKQIVVESA